MNPENPTLTEQDVPPICNRVSLLPSAVDIHLNCTSIGNVFDMCWLDNLSYTVLWESVRISVNLKTRPFVFKLQVLLKIVSSSKLKKTF